MEDLAVDDPRREQFEHDLDDLFLVVQAMSYPGNYVAESRASSGWPKRSTSSRKTCWATTTARIRGARRATVTFGEPIPIEPQKGKKEAAAALTRVMEERVQALLDGR